MVTTAAILLLGMYKPAPTPAPSRPPAARVRPRPPAAPIPWRPPAFLVSGQRPPRVALPYSSPRRGFMKSAVWPDDFFEMEDEDPATVLQPPLPPIRSGPDRTVTKDGRATAL